MPAGPHEVVPPTRRDDQILSSIGAALFARLLSAVQTASIGVVPGANTRNPSSGIMASQGVIDPR